MASGLVLSSALFPVRRLRDTRPILWGLVDLWPFHVPGRPWEHFKGFTRRHRVSHTVGKLKKWPYFEL